MFLCTFYVVVVGGAHQHSIFPFTEVAPWLRVSVYKSRTLWTILDWKIHFVFSLLWGYSWSHRPFCPLASNLAEAKCRCCISGSKYCIWMEAGRVEHSGSTQNHSIEEYFRPTVIWFQWVFFNFIIIKIIRHHHHHRHHLLGTTARILLTLLALLRLLLSL